MVGGSGYEDVGRDSMSTSTRLARVIVRQIIEAGITDVVISPGSRNAPLSLAFIAAEARGLIKVHIRIDERSGAFFALGITKATGRPVPIVCTSGTAVANYHPAVLEASHSNLPLFVLTADRPAALRRTGANQTTEQARIFGKAVRYFADVSGPVFPLELPLNSLQSGPVHLNIQFDEPLLPDDDTNWLDHIVIKPPQTFTRKKPGIFISKSIRGVLVIGHDRGGLSVKDVKNFADQLKWPVISEDPLSFENAFSHASVFLTSKTIRESLAPDTVVIIGRTTLSRSINTFIASARKSIVIDPRIATVDSDRLANQRFLDLPKVDVFPADHEWMEKWEKFSDRTTKVISELETWSEPVICRKISESLASGQTLFISSSRPIRDIEGFAKVRGDIETYANRGLAGIDGNISTALGIASTRDSAVALMGDLAFLHDLPGLIFHEQINLKIYVINNDGGGIFSTLPQSGVVGFEKAFGTPHGRDISAIATAIGIASHRISSFKELEVEIARPITGLSVVVLDVPDRESNAQFIKQIYSKMDSL